MKTIKKVLIIIAVIIIAIGMFILGRNGLNYTKGYTENLLVETAKGYTLYAVISTLIILIYMAARYSKQGIIKVITISILGILGAITFALAVIAILKMPTTRFFFPIILVTYVSSIVVLSAYFEKNV